MRSQEPLALHGFFHALGQQKTKARKGNGGPCAAPVSQGTVETQSTQHYAAGDVQHQDPGGGEFGFIDEDLANGT